MRNVKKIILERVKNKGSVDSDAIAEACNISRQAAHQHLSELVKTQKLLKIGKTRGSYYVLFSDKRESCM